MKNIYNLAEKFAMKLGLESRPSVAPRLDELSEEEVSPPYDSSIEVIEPDESHETLKYVVPQKYEFKRILEELSISMNELRMQINLEEYVDLLENIEHIKTELSILQRLVHRKMNEAVKR